MRWGEEKGSFLGGDILISFFPANVVAGRLGRAGRGACPGSTPAPPGSSPFPLGSLGPQIRAVGAQDHAGYSLGVPLPKVGEHQGPGLSPAAPRFLPISR